VRVATAGPGEVDASLMLPGEVRPNGDRLAHLAPRFAGIAKDVRKQVGDAVRTGEVLAVIESDSLSAYELRAPFDGTVLDRHVVPGESVSRDRAAFIIADLRTVWVDVAVYQRALPRVWPGRAVHITAAHGSLEADATVAFVAPVVDQATRTASARVVLPNPEGSWRPGLFVSAMVSDPIQAAVAVPRAAVQRVDGVPVVFVADDEHFAPRAVVLGRVGRTRAEVVSGLAAGERFAVDGAFLVKAELEKGEAGHGH
jgi:cobalt-zinc-cadmium efflux system membrane fusion protein